MTKPANAPTTVDVLVADETKHADGSQPAKMRKQIHACNKLPRAVNSNVIFI